MLTVANIRQKFINFFENNKHKVAKSASLVPENDPTLMFVNAGMVQFKNCFTGLEKPVSSKITTAQKCVRAGGKHNDLDNVGYTARHHTFFEMLGNFSFGDYFKKEAIHFSWDFLIKELDLPVEKLLVTIYHDDEESYNIWSKEIGLSEDKIIRISTNDNFWSMGETGPCGPCTEIFYDHGEDVAGGKPGTPEEDGDRYVEIWNIVFMQFDRQENGGLIDLPKPCVDTGAGLERLAAVLQGVHNNYEIDLFSRIIENSKLIIGKGEIASHRIIADHLRSSAFLIADGVLPSNEGRGYVLRRIMRRAMRHIFKLGNKTSCMYKLVPTLVNLMGNDYDELNKKESYIMEVIKNEEDKFRLTLERGMKILKEEIDKLK